MTLDPKVANTFVSLIREFSSEIDLHYEDDELHVTEPAMNALRDAAEILSRNGGELPDAYLHLVGRYSKATGGAK